MERGLGVATLDLVEDARGSLDDLAVEANHGDRRLGGQLLDAAGVGAGQEVRAPMTDALPVEGPAQLLVVVRVGELEQLDAGPGERPLQKC
jgi:hypothetical protein